MIQIVLILAGLALLAFLLWALFRPIPISGLVSRPNPVQTYEEAEQRISQWEQDEANRPMQDVCRTKFFTHGEQTGHAIVFIHGYTTCPEQFHQLGQRFFEKGYNVFIPCMPHHGDADRLSDALRTLSAEEMAVFGDQALDIARGLGKKVTVFGISGGGTVTCWLAQNRADLEYAVPLAAFLGVNLLPDWANRLFANLFLALPFFYIWWDPRTKDQNPYSIYYAYPRYSFRNVAQILRLGFAVEEKARQEAPKAGRILMVINDFDPGVSNARMEKIVRVWKAHGKQELGEYHFEREKKMLHDIITPGTPGVPIDEVYARIEDQILKLHAKAEKDGAPG